MSVILPGSYDPVTKGHLDIIRRAAEKYDEVYVVVFTNPKKKYMFSVEDRVRMLMIVLLSVWHFKHVNNTSNVKKQLQMFVQLKH